MVNQRNQTSVEQQIATGAFSRFYMTNSENNRTKQLVNSNKLPKLFTEILATIIELATLN